MSNIEETKIPGLYVLERPTFSDERGFFRELYHLDELVSCISGQGFHAIADLRPDSPTFGMVETFIKDRKNPTLRQAFPEKFKP